MLSEATVVGQSVTGEARAEAEAQAGGSTIDEVNDRRHATNGPTARTRTALNDEADQSSIGEVPREAGTDTQAKAHRTVATRKRFSDESVRAHDGRRVEARLFDHGVLDGGDGLDGLDADVDVRNLTTDLRVVVGLGDDESRNALQRSDLGRDGVDLGVERNDLRVRLGRLLGRSRLRHDRSDRSDRSDDRGAGIRAGLRGELGLDGRELRLQVLQLGLLGPDGVDQRLTADVGGLIVGERGGHEGHDERNDHDRVSSLLREWPCGRG